MYIPDRASDEQRALRESVRDFLERRSPERVVRTVSDSESGFDAALWAEMAEMGLQGLMVPEEAGGVGLGPAEQAIVFQELGRALTPVPMLGTALAIPLLLAAGKAGEDLVAQVAEGALIATVALYDGTDWTGQHAQAGATKTGEAWQVTGRREYVIDGNAAALVLVPVRVDGELAVFAVGSSFGVTKQALTSFDLTRRLTHLDFNGAPADLLLSGAAAEEALAESYRAGLFASIAETCGAAEFILGMSVQYAGTRYQFGRLIGEFQAIKHKLADMAFDLERMKSALTHLVRASSTGAADLDIALHLAKAYCAEAGFRIAAETIQVHGGIGFTWEHPAHLYYRKLKSHEVLLDPPQLHRERMLELAIAKAA